MTIPIRASGRATSGLHLKLPVASDEHVVVIALVGAVRQHLGAHMGQAFAGPPFFRFAPNADCDTPARRLS